VVGVAPRVSVALGEGVLDPLGVAVGEGLSVGEADSVGDGEETLV
jgi:hypothetical protein